MSEPNQGLDSLEYSGPDQIIEFDVEVIPDQEGIDAVIAWSKAEKTSSDPSSAPDDETGNKKSRYPDRPAA